MDDIDDDSPGGREVFRAPAPAMQGKKLARILLGSALALLSGALLTLGFAPHDVWWLIWVAFVPMVVAQYRVLPPAWSALAPALGVGGFMAGYFGGVFPQAAAWYMKALPLIVAVVVFVSAFVSSFAASRGGRNGRDRLGDTSWPLTAAATWVAFELLRMFVPALGTWGFVGYALYRQAWMIQPVRVVGIFGLDLLIMLVNYALATAVIAGLDRNGVFAGPVVVAPRHAARWCGGVLAALAVWTAFSLSSRERGDSTMIRVAALQPGVRRFDAGGTSAARDRAMLDRLAAQTREAAARGARLVVWPEGALAVDPATDHARELASLARDTGAYLVVGYRVRTPAGLRNEAVTIDPGAGFVGRYGKDHPVGFLGETSLSRGTYATVSATLGGAGNTGGTPGTTIGTMICADTDFTGTVRRLALRGAKVIAVPSADWPAIATKHYTLSVFRALEAGAVIAKSEYNLDSAIIDGYGRIAASAVTPGGAQAVLVADVPLRDGVPLAARLGDWVGWLCLAGISARLLWRSRAGKVGIRKWASWATLKVD